jgi:hypothetical protein
VCCEEYELRDEEKMDVGEKMTGALSPDLAYTHCRPFCPKTVPRPRVQDVDGMWRE